MECECEPPIMTVEHDGVWKCEGCGRGIPAGTRVYLYRDEDDDTVVAHIECPPRAQA
jgi:ribosomal protein L37AE/L43A